MSSPSINKTAVTQYMDAFNETDHEKILSLLTEDVEWVMPGFSRAKLKS